MEVRRGAGWYIGLPQNQRLTLPIKGGRGMTLLLIHA